MGISHRVKVLSRGRGHARGHDHDHGRGDGGHGQGDEDRDEEEEEEEVSRMASEDGKETSMQDQQCKLLRGARCASYLRFAAPKRRLLARLPSPSSPEEVL